jgi:tRNA pseudouridine55 synthase
VARKRKGKRIHGWVIIDKPVGMTSAQVTARVKWLFDAQKAGHGGTLDPAATGVLPIALGEATKTVSYVMLGAKKYSFKIRWGEARDTDDAEGRVTAESAERPERDAILAALPEFIGDIEQTPPAYSAIKLDGRRAYAMARAGEAVVIAPRRVRVDDFQLIGLVGDDHAAFEVCSGKGVYMRSLARDLALRLGTVGHIQDLRRISVGPFTEKESISLESLETLVHSAPLSECLLAVETALDDIPALALNATQADHLRHGRPVRVRDRGGRIFVDTGSLEDGDVLCAMADGRPVALARIAADEIHAVRVLNI